MSDEKDFQNRRYERKIYCGNNKLYKGLLTGTHRLGTRYECFRKGYGIGIHQDINVNESNVLRENNYEPIDERKMYCGNKERLPRGYSFMGNTILCLDKGKRFGYFKKLKQESKDYLDNLMYDDSSQEMFFHSKSPPRRQRYRKRDRISPKKRKKYRKCKYSPRKRRCCRCQSLKR